MGTSAASRTLGSSTASSSPSTSAAPSESSGRDDVLPSNARPDPAPPDRPDGGRDRPVLSVPGARRTHRPGRVGLRRIGAGDGRTGPVAGAAPFRPAPPGQTHPLLLAAGGL